MMESYWRTNVR